MFVCRWVALLLLSSVLDAAASSPASTLSAARFQPRSAASLPPSISPTLPPSLPSLSDSGSFQEPQDISNQDQCSLVISPSELVVRFGDPLSANCSNKGTMKFPLGWQVGSDTDLTMASFAVFGINNLTMWDLKPSCFVMVEHGGHCSGVLHLTVYKPPDNVSISFVNHTGPLIEGHQYTLQCHIQDVAPVQNLTVSFYRGDDMLGRSQFSKNPVATPVTETFTISINSSRDDDGVQYWCETVLNLGPHGPQPPPVRRSQKLKAMVYYGPHSLCPKELHLREGEALSWEVRGNPQPSVTWLRDGKVVTLPTHPRSEQAGEYTISARGALGWLNCTMKVDFLRAKGTSNTNCGHFILIGLLMPIQFIYWVSNQSM